MNENKRKTYESQRAYYAKHREEILLKARQYRLTHPHNPEYGKKYYQEHKAEYLDYSKKYYAKNALAIKIKRYEKESK